MTAETTVEKLGLMAALLTIATIALYLAGEAHHPAVEPGAFGAFGAFGAVIAVAMSGIFYSAAE